MYLPKHFEVTNKQMLVALIRDYGFATLVTSSSDAGLFASHVPILYWPERGTHGVLAGHVARANPQSRYFNTDKEALVIFQGPHAYVSPSWYQVKPAVPTWNYATVHAYGKPRILEDELKLAELLRATVEQYESGMPVPWQADLPADYQAAQMKAIVGFEIEVTRIEGKFKLSQNRKPEDVAGVIQALTQSESQTERELASLMRSYYQQRH